VSAAGTRNFELPGDPITVALDNSTEILLVVDGPDVSTEVLGVLPQGTAVDLAPLHAVGHAGAHDQSGAATMPGVGIPMMILVATPNRTARGIRRGVRRGVRCAVVSNS